MYIDRNEYFLVKSDLKDNIDMVFKRREITAANIARLYGDEVCGSRDTEENIILENRIIILIMHALTTDGLNCVMNINSISKIMVTICIPFLDILLFANKKLIPIII